MAYDPTSSFGDYLRFLRRRARLTQSQLSIAVGYSPGQISMLENGQRTPDVSAVAALFVPALGLEDDANAAAALLHLAQQSGSPALLAQSSATHPAPGATVSQEIVWQREELGVLEAIPPLPAHWVNRPDIQRRLHLLLQRERTVVLCGLPGMGKSSLAAAYAHEHAARHPVLWLTLREESPLSPDILLRQLALFAVAHAPYAAYTAPLTRHLAGQGAPLAAGQLLLALEAALAQQAAPLLVMDDAHLLNRLPDALHLLARLSQRAATLRLLLPSREEIDAPGLHHLALNGLEPGEMAALLSRLSAHPEPSPLLDLAQLQGETGGNPLLVRLAVTRSQAGGEAGGAGALVHNLLAALSPSARLLIDFLALLRGAANLTAPGLAERCAAEMDGYDHSAGLAEIRRCRLVDRLEQAQLHPLLREPLLLQMASRPAHFRRMQRMAGEWAAAAGDRAGAARHLAAAGALEEACDLLLGEERLPDRAEGLAAVEELLAACGRAEGLPQRKERLRGLLLLRGDLLIHTTWAEEARESYRRALEATDGRLAQAQLAERLAVSFFETGRAQDALDLCEEALKLVAWDLSGEGVRLRLKLGGAQVKALIALSRFDEAAALCHKAQDAARLLRLVKPKAADEVVAGALYALGYVRRIGGDLEEARRNFLQSVRYAKAAESREVEAGSLAYLAVLQREMGDLPGAVESADAALALAEAAGNDYLFSSILHIQSITGYWQDNLAHALALSARARAMKEAMLDVEGVIGCDVLQGLVLSALGRLAEAQARLEAALLQCQLVNNSWLEGIALYVRGVVRAMGGDLAGGEVSIDQALALPGFVVDTPYRVSAQLYRGVIYLAQGRIPAAQAALAEPLPRGAAKDIVHLAGLLQAMLHYAAGDQPRMQAALDELAAHAQSTGHLVYRREALRLAQLAPLRPALADLPRLVSCPAQEVAALLAGEG